MSDGVHLLVPFAWCAPLAAQAAPLRLPNLQRLLARLAPDGDDEAPPDSLSAPHERALARAGGLQATDGLIPLAAWQACQEGRGGPGEPWAWITPCHWQVGRDHIRMAPLHEMRLDGEDSRAMLAAMHPYFAEDGIHLEYEGPLRWLARGELFRHLPTASLDRVAGRTIAEPWMPSGKAGRPLRRLQQEMQMLLYTLPLNDARQRGGLLPVNSFWASGTGALPATEPPVRPSGLRMTPQLRDAALLEDGAAWRAAWQQLDAQECARLLADLDQGRDVRLTLCGEARARSWSSRQARPFGRLRSLIARPAVAAVLEAL